MVSQRITLVFVSVAAVIVLLLAWFLVSPLFLDRVVDEDFPLREESGDALDDVSDTLVLEEDMPSDASEALEAPSPLPTLEYTGSFMDADSFHTVSGAASVFSVEDMRFVRFEDFSATNGPDLYVYLATDEAASDFVNLGRLKGNKGDQNYEVPADVDLTVYDTVLIWCRAFGVLFGSAELEAQ